MDFKPAQCPSCGGALQVPDDRASVKCMYCGVDVTVREAIQLSAGRVKKFTTGTPIKTKLYTSSVSAFLMVLGWLILPIGVVLLCSELKPVAITLLILALAFIVGGTKGTKTDYTEKITGVVGKCPYCETSIVIPLNAPGANCEACTKRIVLRDMKFISVDTPLSGLDKSEL